MNTLPFKRIGLAQVHWRNKLTGLKGFGLPINKSAAYAAVEQANKEHPDILHWVEFN